MAFLEIYAIAGLVILGMMLALWLVSLLLKNSSIVDIFWGTGFVVTGWVYFALTPDGFPVRKALMAALVTVWGLRLSLHILWRNWGKPEDFRYQKWRDESGAIWWWKSFFKVFLLQGFLMWVISALSCWTRMSFSRPRPRERSGFRCALMTMKRAGRLRP